MRRPCGRVGRVAIVLAAAASAASCADSDPDLPTELSALAYDTVFELGAASGAAHEAFEGVWDVELDADGRVALLDIGRPAVHVYDEHGRHLASVRDVGLAEGELDGPTGIAWSAPGRLSVWDPGSSWISTFDLGADGLAFTERRRAFAFGETGFCARDDRTFLSYFGLQDGNVVHEVGPDGPVRSFGPAPDVVGADSLGPELREIVLEELTPSALLCTSAGVLDVSFLQSSVRLHGSDGAPVWGREFDAFRPVVAYSPDGIGLGRSFDAGDGSHLLRSVVAWGASAVLVQHELRRREIPVDGEVEVFESRLVRLADGGELDRTRALPLVLAARGRRLALAGAGPVAGVTVVELR